MEEEGSYWKTSITYVEKNKILVRGYRIEDLMENLSYGETFYLIFKGELPNRKWKKILDALLIAGCDHSLFCPSVAAARYVASGGVGLQNAIASGVNALGKYHGGAIEGAMKFFYILKEEIKKEGRMEEAVKEFVLKYLKKEGRVPGFGHKLHTDKDPRVLKLFQIAQECGLKGEYLEIARNVEEALAEIKGRKLPLNIDGAMAAVACELGFDWRMGRAIFVLSRGLGIAAHSYEEIVNGRPFKEVPLKQIRYVGPKERGLPIHRRDEK